MLKWITWFGRGAERDRAYERLESLQQTYGELGARVIKLSGRTDLARRSAGSTQRAFDLVESAFAEATSEYAHVGEQIEAISFGLEKGRVGDFTAAEASLKTAGSKLDELDRQLTAWESRWQQVPLEVDEIGRALDHFKQEVARAEERAGGPLPLSRKAAAMEQHRERIRQALAAGNPVEASHLVGDLRLALEKLTDDLNLYLSAAGAIQQAEQELAAARSKAQEGAPAETVVALAAAEALLPRLRAHLSEGRLEHFQQDLLAVQKQLAAARSRA